MTQFERIQLLSRMEVMPSYEYGRQILVFGLYMHCHIDRHMIEGMALMLNKSFDQITETDIPKGLPTCHSFKNDQKAPSLDKETSKYGLNP